MPLGRKVADIYAELNLDKDTIRQAMASAGNEMGADADRLGRQLGDRMSKGMAGQVEQLSARLAKTRLAEQKATDAVALAQARLNEANAKGNVEGSRLLALEQRLSQATAALAIAHDNTTRAATKHADAERRLAADVENLGKAIGPAADKAGRDTGDKLSQGIHLAIVRNSPLIAAGIGAALAVGAPVAIAGATALFAGIGIAAAAQNDKVKLAWSNTWQSIVKGTKQDASVLQLTVADMAGQVGSAFQRMRPLMRDAFESVAPLLHDFTDSLLQAAQNALPGLVHAVEASGPVFDGLGSLVERIGTGLSGFFEAISQHGEAAGRAFDAIGRIVGAVLPVLGNFLGTGVELASVVLPPLAGVLEIVAKALQSIQPILPAVAAGFGAMKIVQTLSGPLGSVSGGLTKFAQNAAFASYQGGAFGKAAGAVSEGASSAASGASKLSAAMPVIGAILAGVSVVMERTSDQSRQWAQALLDGGQAAETAQAQMSNFGTAMQTTNTGFAGVITGLVGFGAQADATALSLKGTQDAQDQITASLTPMQAAQQAVTTAQNDLNLMVDRYGPSSGQAVAAAQTYRDAQAAVAAQSDATQLAIQGVTDAMLAQADQALANASSSFAYDTATQKVADAQARLAEVQKDSKSTSADLNDATNSLNHALLAQVEAAGRLAADSLPATATETQKATAANGAMLQQLYQLRDTMGSAFPAALQNAITGLQRSGATANNYSAQAYGALSATQNLVGGLFNLGQQHPQPSVTVQPGNSVGILSTIKAGIDRLYSKTIYINTINTVRNILGMGGSAAGGAVDDIPAIKAATGRVVGPGGPTEDRVPAVGPGGTPWRLSPGEWVVKAAAVRALEAQYGATAMPTINSGRLPVATDTGSSGSLMKVSGGAASTVSVGELHLHFEGTWDLTNPQQLRAVGSKIRDVIIKLDREVR